MKIDQSKLPKHQRISTTIDVEYKNVCDLFFQKSKKNPHKKFLFCPGKNEKSYTYIELEQKILSTAKYLEKNGFKKGDRINLVVPNSAEFVILYFAGLLLGMVIVPINEDLSPVEMLYVINDSKSKAVFYDPAYKHKLDEIEVPSAISIEKIKDLPSQNPGKIEETTIYDDAIIIYTSGTTGNPKGVVLTHLNLLADAKAVSEWFELTENSRTLCILPMFHNNGQVMTLLNPLYAGGSTVIVKGKASLMSFWGLIEKYLINWTSVMPSILSILLSLKKERTDNSFEGIFCGGQILTKSVQEEFESRFGVPIFEGFGLTETTSFACFNDYPAKHRKIGSIGRPLSANEMTIMDENDKELKPFEEGEICIRGLNVAKEYLGLPDKNMVAFRDGWFHSGDYGYKDERNYFYFKTRKDFLIIKGGENIYPAELENVLFRHPSVAESAVIGIPDDLLGEEICAFVALNDKIEITVEELKEFCKGKIANFKQAKEIIIIEEIPKGPTKKVLYRKLKEYYLNSHK